MKLSTRLILIGGISMLSANAVSADQFTSEADMTIVSQYLFRGFDMAQEDPAIQGSATVNHESGFWMGVWASNYDTGMDDGVEVDLIGGYDLSLTDDISMTLGFTTYSYSGDIDASTEIFISASYKWFTFSYNDDMDLNTVYVSLDADLEIAENVTLNIHGGNYDYEFDEDNSDFSATVNYAVNDKFSVFATYSTNDMDVQGAEDYFIAGLSYTF